jgi:polyisoprenoid-binding protein YceI
VVRSDSVWVSRVTRRRVGTALGAALVSAIMTWSAVMAEMPVMRKAALELDPGRTQINFSLQGSLHTANGRFKLKRGAVRLDPATGEADGILIVDAASGDSGNRKRDTGMKEDVLEAPRYPEISFVPQHVEGEAASEGEFPLKVHGVLSLHGAEHDITLDALVHVVGDEVTVSSRFIVPYVEWGLKDPSIFLLWVADKVEVRVNLVGRLTWISLTEKEPGDFTDSQ